MERKRLCVNFIYFKIQRNLRSGICSKQNARQETPQSQSRGSVEMKDKTKHKYLVGYVGEWSSVYGTNNWEPGFVRPMTLKDAKETIKMFSENHPKRIYKLVPVRTIK